MTCKEETLYQNVIGTETTEIKVRKFRNDFLKFSFAPKNERCPYFFDLTFFLESRAEIQKYFRSFFGANENLENSFRNQLTFRTRYVSLAKFL